MYQAKIEETYLLFLIFAENRKQMSNFKAWVQAFRLRTLPLALSSILMGSFVAAGQHLFKWPILVLAVLTTLFLQILSNLANDYGDTVNGADHKGRQGPLRMVQSGAISQKAMRKAILFFVILSLAAGLGLIYVAFSGHFNWLFLLFFVLGLGAIAAAMRYTMGKNPYGYRGLGDVYVLLFFGFLGVGGTFYLHGLALDLSVILPALAVGFLSAGVLNVNNMRDRESDLEAGKYSLVVRFGIRWAKNYHITLVGFALMALVFYVLLKGSEINNWLFLLGCPLFVRHLKVIAKARKADEFDPELKKLAISTFVLVLLFGTGLIL